MMQRWVMEKFCYPGVYGRLLNEGYDISLEHLTDALNGECDMDLDLARALCDVLDLQCDELQKFAIAYMYRHDPSARPDRLTALEESQVESYRDIGA